MKFQLNKWNPQKKKKKQTQKTTGKATVNTTLTFLFGLLLILSWRRPDPAVRHFMRPYYVPLIFSFDPVSWYFFNATIINYYYYWVACKEYDKTHQPLTYKEGIDDDGLINTWTQDMDDVVSSYMATKAYKQWGWTTENRATRAPRWCHRHWAPLPFCWSACAAFLPPAPFAQIKKIK